MDAGKLVDDATVLGMIRERLAQPDAAKGFILDGFPRNIAQAEALEKLLIELGKPLEAVVLLNLDLGMLFKRLTGRRICQDCGRCSTSTPRRGHAPHCEKCGDIAAPDPAARRQGRGHRQAARGVRGADQAADQALRGARAAAVVDADADVQTVFASIRARVERRGAAESA
jgi:adenylate kinase